MAGADEILCLVELSPKSDFQTEIKDEQIEKEEIEKLEK